MIVQYLISVAIILGVFAAWIAVQHAARAFARRHPEFGPAKEEGMGCGMFCRCSAGDTCPFEDVEKPQADSQPAAAADPVHQ